MMVQHCTACESRWFPDRLLCPACGGASFERVEMRRCRIEQVTALADGTLIASARASGEVPLVVRLIGDVVEGDDVPLTTDPTHHGPAAYLPTRLERNEEER